MNRTRPVLFQACGTVRGKNAQVPGLPTVTSSGGIALSGLDAARSWATPAGHA